MFFCCLLCCLVKPGLDPGQSPTDFLQSNLFGIEHGELILCIYGCTQPSPCAWAAQGGWGGLLGDIHNMADIPSWPEKHSWCLILSWEPPSPLQWFHHEHQLSVTGVSIWNPQQIQTGCKLLPENSQAEVMNGFSRLQAANIMRWC